MTDPTTDHGRHQVQPYTRAVAQILIAALDDQNGDTVPRTDLRRAWYSRYPDQDRHSGVGKGRVGRPRLNGAIRDLDALGVIERHPDTVRVLDRERLTEIANTEFTDSNEEGGG